MFQLSLKNVLGKWDRKNEVDVMVNYLVGGTFLIGQGQCWAQLLSIVGLVVWCYGPLESNPAGLRGYVVLGQNSRSHMPSMASITWATSFRPLGSVQPA